jgi:ABC-type polysaccharide/polyol phosphate export permease
METQHSQSETKTPHSIIGCLSSVFATFAIFEVIGLLFVLLNPHIGGFGAELIFIISISCLCVCIPVSIILGIIGIFTKNRKRLFSVIGLIIPALLLFTSVVWFVVKLIQS